MSRRNLADPAALSATDAAEAIRERRLTSEALVRACLDRIAEREPDVQAWAHLDPEYALAQAREIDAVQRSGGATGPLHGVPIGIKDIFDTADFPTENGSPIFVARRPKKDAACVTLLRAAGAVILAKTSDHGACAAYPRAHAPPAQKRAHAGRLLCRLGGGGGGGHGAGGCRQPDGGLRDPAGVVLRRLRLQADAWAHPALRRAHAVAHARYRGCARPLGRGRGAPDRLHGGLRSGG